jgi:hypothetical protein
MILLLAAAASYINLALTSGVSVQVEFGDRTPSDEARLKGTALAQAMWIDFCSHSDQFKCADGNGIEITMTLNESPGSCDSILIKTSPSGALWP